MGLGPRFGQDILVIPIYAPADVGSNDVRTDYVNVSNAHRVTLLLQFGDIDNDSKVITVEESTGNSTSNAEAIPFMYRKSGSAVGTGDSWGAVTTASSVGVDMGVGDDDKSLLIDIDPSALTEGDSYLAIRILSASAVCFASAVALLVPRYAQLDHISTT